MTPLKLIAAAWALAVSSMAVSTAPSQRRVLDFTLVNTTPLTIMEMYVSPATGGDWGRDVLGQDIVRPGEQLDVAFSRSETTCLWDVRIVDEDNRKRQWARFNLCEASAITLRLEKGKLAATVQ